MSEETNIFKAEVEAVLKKLVSERITWIEIGPNTGSVRTFGVPSLR